MFKRQLSILFLCLANLVMLGHGLVPHHHHRPHATIDGHDHHHNDPDHGAVHHAHGTAEANGQHGAEDDHGHTPFHFEHAPLAYLLHNGEGDKLDLQGISPCVLTEKLVGELMPQPKVDFKPSPAPLVHETPPCQAPGLRAPPSFIV